MAWPEAAVIAVPDDKVGREACRAGSGQAGASIDEAAIRAQVEKSVEEPATFPDTRFPNRWCSSGAGSYQRQQDQQARAAKIIPEIAPGAALILGRR